MRAIVTGGCGFIGSHLVEQLIRRKFDVAVVDNLATGRRDNLKDVGGDVELIEIDIATEPDALRGAFRGAHYIFHLAGLADIVPSIEKPRPYFETNVRGTLHVLEAAREVNPAKLVYAASSSCYGLPDVFPTPETAEIRPMYPYALTKRLGEELVMHYGEIYGLNVASARLFNVFGPRARTSGTYGAVLGVFLAQKLANKPLTVVGDGTQTRDFTHVSDVAKAFVAIAESSVSGEIMNVGTGRDVSVNRLADLLGGPRVQIPKRPGEPDCTLADVRKISTLVGWKAEMSFEDGIRDVLDHIDYWRDAPVWTPESIEKATAAWMNALSTTRD